MNRALALALAAAGVWALASVASSSASASPGTVIPPDPGGTMSAKARLYAQLESLPELSENQRLALMFIAHGESHYSVEAFNGSASEAQAAGKAFDRLQEQGRLNAACGYTRAELALGSGGRFQRLIPYFVNDLRDLAPCVRPAAVRDGVSDLASAIVTAAAITRNPHWNGTILGLRGGWGTLAWVDGDAPPATQAKWRRHIDEGGFAGAGHTAQSFLDRKLARFPAMTPAMFARLRAGAAVA